MVTRLLVVPAASTSARFGNAHPIDPVRAAAVTSVELTDGRIGNAVGTAADPAAANFRIGLIRAGVPRPGLGLAPVVPLRHDRSDGPALAPVHRDRGLLERDAS